MSDITDGLSSVPGNHHCMLMQGCNNGYKDSWMSQIFVMFIMRKFISWFMILEKLMHVIVGMFVGTEIMLANEPTSG